MPSTFPAAPVAIEPDDDEPTDPGSLPIPASCRCDACDERSRADELASRCGASQVTVVRTPRLVPEYKAFVSTLTGATGVGHGHSDAQAIFEALRALGAG